MARVTKTLNPLHFEDLEPHRFEDLVRQLIYDFRDWSLLEAVGRSGADDGIDIRGIETINDSMELEENEGDTPIFARSEPVRGKIWIIQCKRYSKISPKKVKEIVETNLSPQLTPPYGYLLIAACDFSEASRRRFAETTAKYNIQESYVIGKAELEDMLFRPSNDHLLFAYFGISLQIRRRSSRTQLKSNIALKRALIKHLGELDERSDKYVLIRDPRDRNYPVIEASEDFWENPSWRYWQFFGHNRPNNLIFIKRKCYASYNKGTNEWDVLLDFDAGHPHPTLYDMPDKTPEMEARAVEYERIWSFELPHRYRAWYYELGIIPYDRILALDDLGDASNEGPHLFVDFRSPLNPFEPGTIEVIEYDQDLYRVDNLNRNSYLKDLRDQLRKENATISKGKRYEITLGKMAHVRIDFIDAVTKKISDWYWGSVTSRVENQSDCTLNLGQERLSELKLEVKTLQHQAVDIVKEFLDVEELWWDRVQADQHYSFYGNRPPEKLDDAIRLVAGLLGPILEQFGYIEQHELRRSWRKSSNQQYSADTRPYYASWFEWSDDMRLLLEDYEILHNRAKNLAPSRLPKEKSDKSNEKVKQLWENA